MGIVTRPHARNQGVEMRFDVLVFVPLLFSSVSSYAESTDLLATYALARANDPIYQAARSEHEAILQGIPEARGTLLPNVAFTAEFTETDQEIVSSDNQVFGQGNSSYPTDTLSLSITQPIFRYENIVQLKQAKANVREAGVRLIASEQELILRSASRYLDVLAAKDDLEFALAEQEANKLQLDQITRRKEVGFANATEVYESRARYEFTRSTVAEARGDLAERIDALLEITAQRITDIVPLSDRLPLAEPDPSDAEQWIAKALQGNLTLQARIHQVEASELEVRRQRAGAFPTLDLLVNSEQRTTEGSLFGGGSEVDTTDVLIRFRAPLFQGGQVRARRLAASHRYDQAQQFAEQERRVVSRETRSAYLGVVNGITKINALEQSVQSQKLTLESKQKGFVAGTNTNLEVLDAQRDLYLVLRDHAQARYDYLLSMLDLKAQVGSLAIEDIEEVNRWLKNE
ncbi:MAG: hypothetical protein DWQ08_03910 [Proteobacteria bacterium]|nr:MAG: hypothetical protein DWQ08_03910 [Pseudomonadota bacterium]